MSRSYRKPYSAICGGGSADWDKTTARRGVRHRQNQWLRTLEDFEEALAPHKFECAWNETYCWGRDGSQGWMEPSDYDWRWYLEYHAGVWRGTGYEERERERHSLWPPKWYRQLKRK